MCTSRPSIPKNTTPVAPPPPQPGPDALTIGNEREQMARARGLQIIPKPDLSGLGNQDLGTPTNFLQIGPDSNLPYDPVARAQQLQVIQSTVVVGNNSE